MSRRLLGRLTVVLAVLLAGACGEKPSAIRDGAAARRAALRESAPAEPAPPSTTPVEVAAGAPNPAAPADGSPATDGTGPPPAAPPAPADAAGGPPAAASSGPPPAALPAPSRRSSGARGRSGPAYFSAEPQPFPADSGAGSRNGPPSPASPSPAPPAPTPAPPREALPGPIDRTGVTDTTIRIGIHAPVTGAAPFPQKAFEQSYDLYWKYLAAKGGVWGRNVQVVFRDDQYNPTSAVEVCRDMVEQQKVFAIIGFAGTDQINACARYAESAGVPYFSGGVNEDGLAGLNRYFAISQTYDQQSSTLVKLMKKRIKKTRVAVVVIDTPALNNTVRSITNEITRAGGLQIVRSSRIGKYASDSELLSEAQLLRNSGAEVVYVIAAPIPFIKLATDAQAQAYMPTWIGPGTTNGFAVVAEVGCPAIGAAKFLSPFPQLDAIDELDPDYKAAYRHYVGNNPDDIGILNWGMNKVVHQMLEATGRDLSRQSFLAAVTSGRAFRSNVYPEVSYDGTIRFGARTAHLLEADCTTRSWKTTGRFVADF